MEEQNVDTVVSFAFGDQVSYMTDSEDETTKTDGLVTDITVSGRENAYCIDNSAWVTIAFHAMKLVKRATQESLDSVFDLLSTSEEEERQKEIAGGRRGLWDEVESEDEDEEDALQEHVEPVEHRPHDTEAPAAYVPRHIRNWTRGD